MRMPISIPATRVMDVEKVWLTRKEAAKYLGVSVDFIKSLCLNMRIPWYKVCASNASKGGDRRGREGICFIKKKDLDRFIGSKAHRVCGEGGEA